MLPNGTTIAGYRIDGILGRGGMGMVYEATQLSLDRVVALKLLAAHLSDDIGFRERFRREGQVQARLEHSHIVTVYEAGESEHGLFIAMRLVRGRTLKEMVTGGELDPERTLRILAPVAEALDEAHGIGLIHRDIKPQNVLVGGRDHAFLADFGLTKGPTEETLTKTGHFVGTFDYIAPEQINGERATAASDVYSLAGVLYECLTGTVPYPKGVEAAVLYAHVADPPPRPTDQRPELPAQLDEVIARAMAKDPATRHSSASELVQDLTRCFARPPAEPFTDSETALRAAEPAPAAATAATPDLTTPGPTAPVAAPRVPTALRAPPPARPAPAARAPRRRAPVPLVAGAGLVVLVAVGFLVGSAMSGDDPAPQRGAPIVAGDLSARGPAAWKRADEPVEVKGLDLREAASVAPDRTGEGTSITIGKSRGTGSTLLPPALVRQLDEPAPSPKRVELGGDLQALRYSGLGPQGLESGTLRLYVAPIVGGVATVQCVEPADVVPGSTTAACDQTAASLELRKGKALPLGPDEGYQRTLDRVVKRLNGATKGQAATLRGADTPGAQARAADSLRASYRSAARSLRGATANPQVTGANKRIIAALEGLAGRYEQLATAARADNAAAYGKARFFIEHGAEERLGRALRAVGA